MVALAARSCGPWIVALTGFAAICGHCFSPFLGGKGGKGVATALGVFAVIAPAVAFVAVGVFLLIAGRTRIPALGSLAGASAATLFAAFTGYSTPLCLLLAATTILLVYTHRGNISRVFTS
jgi:glycerol-3-phosphate acyltransferase PlsY